YDKIDPPCRSRPVAENVRLFREMYEGRHAEGTYTLRLKMNMQDDNPCMRDPVAYRIKYVPHPHTGDAWCIYPSYDMSHCLIDAFENITHSICTLEFNIRRESYDWLTQTAGTYLPMQWEFSRLNITHNVMSKRRLLVMVNQGIVRGWDDPRLLTIGGMRRRGFTPDIINEFCRAVGITRSRNMVSYTLLHSIAVAKLDPVVTRGMMVLRPLKVTLVDYAKTEPKEITVDNHPKDASLGTSAIKWTKSLYIDREDFKTEANRNYFRLTPAQGVGLRYGPNIFVKEVVTGADGEVTEVLCTHDWDRKDKMKAQ
ncbi:hypothetical protein KIPB_012242, partial [Kipferlia bialata]